MFHECKENRILAVCIVYWQEIWTHIPKTRKIARPPFISEVSTNSITFTTPAPLAHLSGSIPLTVIPPNPSTTIPRSSTIKHDLDCGSYVNRQA